MANTSLSVRKVEKLESGKRDIPVGRNPNLADAKCRKVFD